MKKFPILIIIVAVLLTACAPQGQNEISIADQKPELTPMKTDMPPTMSQSEIVDGQRRIILQPGFSAEEIKVHRGETLNIIYKPKGEGETRVLMEGLEVDERFNHGDEISVVVKVKTVGDYSITISENNTEEQGMIQVVDFVKENVFVNASVSEFKEAMTGEYLLLDVRTQEEYDMGHIEGATLIPVSELAHRIDEIEEYMDVPVLVYCRSGNRSITASQILIDHGFTYVVNLKRGFSAYQADH